MFVSKVQIDLITFITKDTLTSNGYEWDGLNQRWVHKEDYTIITDFIPPELNKTIYDI